MCCYSNCFSGTPYFNWCIIGITCKDVQTEVFIRIYVEYERMLMLLDKTNEKNWPCKTEVNTCDVTPNSDLNLNCFLATIRREVLDQFFDLIMQNSKCQPTNQLSRPSSVRACSPGSPSAKGWCPLPSPPRQKAQKQSGTQYESLYSMSPQVQIEMKYTSHNCMR